MNLPVKIIIHNFAVLFCAFVYNIENSHTGCPNNDCFFFKGALLLQKLSDFKNFFTFRSAMN